MKKFAMFLMLLSVSLLTIGCQPSAPAKKTEPGKTPAEQPAGGAEKPAEPAAPK